MHGSMTTRERHAWLAAGSLLAAAVAWTGAISVALWLRVQGIELPAVFTVARALVRALLLVVHQNGPIMIAILLAWSVSAMLVHELLQRRRLEGGKRHA